MTDARLGKVKDIACRLFINEGYSRTQIRDIAKEAGISIGAVYLLFASKKAILDFALQCGIDPAAINKEYELPLCEDQFASMQNDLMVAFYKKGIQFAEPITSDAQGYSFENMLFDAYDIIDVYGTCSLILENNPQGCGKLGPFYIQYKQRFFDTFLRFINIYMERGEVRPLQHPERSVRLMIDTLYDWAVRVCYDGGPEIPPDERKEVCMDALVHAYGR